MSRIGHSLAVCVASLLLLTVVAQIPSDYDCGTPLVALSATQPNVLLVGDSISMVPPYTPGGYGEATRTLLAAQSVTAQHAGGWDAGGQCSNTVKGLLCTTLTQPKNYLTIPGGGLFDVIHINYGLHDLANCTNDPECGEHVDMATYGANLVELWKRYGTIGKRLIWTTTTPVPNITGGTQYGRTYQNVVLYNQQALSSLRSVAPDLLVNDLWDLMISKCGAFYTSCALQRPRDAHLTAAGINATAHSVTDSIMAALKG